MRLSARWRITRYQEFCAFPFASRWPLNRLKLSLMNSSMSLFAILYSFLVLRACGKLLKAAELPTLVVKARGNPRCQTSTDKGPLKKALWKLRLLETWDFLHWAHEAKIWSLFWKKFESLYHEPKSEWVSEWTNQWAQGSKQCRVSVWSKWMSERCKRMCVRKSKLPCSTGPVLYTSIFTHSAPLSR